MSTLRIFPMVSSTPSAPAVLGPRVRLRLFEKLA